MSNFFFPPDVPILDDSIYTALGYFTGSSTAYQRNFAYRIAQSQVEQEIGTFLVPTTITGSFTPVYANRLIESPIGMINSINSVVLHEKWQNGIERLVSGTASLYDPYNGYFTIDRSLGDNSVCGGCLGNNLGIYKASVSITSGYATGTTINNPDILLALAMATEIVLPQMFDRGMGFEYWGFTKTLQVGRTISSLSDKFLKETSFGYSAMAQFIVNLLKPYKIYKVGKLG